MIKYKKDINNIATLMLDMEYRGKNVINHEIVDAFVPVIQHLQREKNKKVLKGVIITSNKKNFLEGGDLEYLYNAKSAEEVLFFTRQLKQLFRDIERPGVPVVAAINGTALGAGFEMALACHHRIVLDQPKIQVGLPEVKLGLIPGGGSVVRLMWLLGIEKSYQVLEEGRLYTPQEALRAGIIDDTAQTPEEMIEKAKTWLMEIEEGRRPWDQPQASIPHGTASHPYVTALIQKLNMQLVKQKQLNFPAQHTILNILAEGSKVDFDTASAIESRYYTELICNKVTKNMIRAFWFDHNAIQSGERRPKGFGKFRPKKVGIIGAGLMGTGIATSCAVNGLEVVLKDVSRVIAEQGKRQIERNLMEMIQRNEVAMEEKQAILKRVTATERTELFESCDLVIEAVFENANVKQKVIKEAEEHLDEYAFIGSNTLSIPITKLAAISNRPENYIGLHFFHPAQQIPLVEIVKGEQTSPETIAKSFDFVKAINKIPIVVRDDWGFYAARVQNTYILESITMLLEGYPPALIENLGLQAGMPKSGLAFADDLGLELVQGYEHQAAMHYGSRYIQHPAVAALQLLSNELGRKGKNAGKGFYEYSEHGSRKIWQELTNYFPTTSTQDIPQERLMERLLFAQVIEAGWCLQEGVVSTVPEANLGSVYGWGFPAYKGGVIQYVFDYGKTNFVERCKFFEQQHGKRFRLPPYLLAIKEM